MHYALLFSLATIVAAAETIPSVSSEQPALPSGDVPGSRIQTFTYRAPWTLSIISAKDRARQQPLNIIRIYALGGMESSWIGDKRTSTASGGVLFYNEGGCGIGDTGFRIDARRRQWLENNNNDDPALEVAFSPMLWWPMFETPTWQPEIPLDMPLVFRVGPVTKATYAVRMEDRQPNTGNDRYEWWTGMRFGVGPLAWLDMVVGRDQQLPGSRFAGELHFPVAHFSQLWGCRLYVFAQADVPLQDRDQSTDRFRAGLEIAASVK